MSRIREALIFDNDDDRRAWFSTLTPEEQAAVIKDAHEVADRFAKALKPIVEQFINLAQEIQSGIMKAWVSNAPSFTELLVQFEQANPKPRNNKRGKRQKRY
jgi:hypothetical protein